MKRAGKRRGLRLNPKLKVGRQAVDRLLGGTDADEMPGPIGWAKWSKTAVPRSAARTRASGKTYSTGSRSVQIESRGQQAAKGYGQPLGSALPLGGAAGFGIRISTRGARMSADGGAVQRDEDELISLPTFLLSDRRGAATRSACTSISSLDISSSFRLRSS